MPAYLIPDFEHTGAERWKLVEMLTEDALVQLTERPSIGADRRLSLAIANAWIETAERVGRSRMQAIMRAAIIDLRIRNEIQLLSALEDDELQAHVTDIFARASEREIPDPELTPAERSKLDALPEETSSGSGLVSLFRRMSGR